jgi:D-3-phosphoglycerate dehydrogenase
MPNYKIVFSDYYYPHNDKEIEILQRLGGVEIIDCTKIEPGGIKDEDKLIPYVEDADALIVQFASISKKVIEALEKCKIIARYAIGVDSIDVEAAKEKGIVIANVPDYCIEEVSDTTIAHMFNCLRKITFADHWLRNNDWSYDKIKPLRRFSNMTVGLLSFGNIARRVSEKLKAFGVNMSAYDPYVTNTEKYPDVAFVSLKDLMSQSDIISVHTPLTQETHHMLNEEAFASVKPGAVLINTSRGGIIEENALIHAIESGKISMAGLDVLDTNDADYYHSAMMKFPDRVCITPHMAWYSEEAIADLQQKTALNVYEMLKNGKPIYPVYT